MLNHLISFALANRLVILMLALATIVIGSIAVIDLPIDVLPDLTRPRVTLITECHGMAPEEVERLVTYHLESAVNGATGVTAVRSQSTIGLSVIQVEFDWGTDIFTARQIVQERVSIVSDRIPEGIQPKLGPISSLLGQIMLIGVWSEDDSTSDLELRTLADWVVAKRLQTISGVSQVIVMGGGKKQYQVRVDPHRLHRYEVSLRDIELALSDSNQNVTGGYLKVGAQEYLVRGLGRFENEGQLRDVVVKKTGLRPILLRQVATVSPAAQVKRGDSSVNGIASVVITVQKQPGADTRRLTKEINQALAELKPSMPGDVRLQVTYEQREFIDFGVSNVLEALRDGAILVIIVLFLFLLNFRTTFITLTAIPLSAFVAAIVFWLMGMSINVMTLGGLAVAIGELVDDAIVDVENIFRRLKQNRQLANPRPVLRVIYDASVEVRNAIIVSTILVIVVFAPLFALSGMEGRLFTPLGIAYVVSILASTLVSLTVTPVLSYYLLPKAKMTQRSGDGPVLAFLKRLAKPVILTSTSRNGLGLIMGGFGVAVVTSGLLIPMFGRDFLPPFDEGAAQLNLFAAPGTSLDTSREISQVADVRLRRLLQTPDNPKGPIRYFTCRTGRAEDDEHVMGVHVSEYVMSLNPDSGVSREQMIKMLHEAVDDIPGVETEVEQPIAHLISHMLSGVTAQIAIKLYGNDLDVLRATAEEIKVAIEDVPGIAPPVVEQQQLIPQLRIKQKYDRLAYYGLTAADVNEFVEIAMNGKVVSQMIDGQRVFDVMLRMDEPFRTDIASLRRMHIELPNGGRIPLAAVADVQEGAGPSIIYHEDAQRRIVVRVNTMGRDLGSTVADIRQRLDERLELPPEYVIELGGQFEAQESATSRILWLSLVALVIVGVVLYSTYPSLSIVGQILMALPAAFVGGVAALAITQQTLSVAAMVGFISLGGIAARNGLLLVGTYLTLAKQKGFSREIVIEGSLERLAPVLMTALTTGIALVPLVVHAHEPGKEVLFPVASVIIGGLITSTLCEFLLRPGMFWLLSGRAVERFVDNVNNREAEFSESSVPLR